MRRLSCRPGTRRGHRGREFVAEAGTRSCRLAGAGGPSAAPSFRRSNARRKWNGAHAPPDATTDGIPELPVHRRAREQSSALTLFACDAGMAERVGEMLGITA